MDTANFVLRPFTKQEHEEVCKLFTFTQKRYCIELENGFSSFYRFLFFFQLDFMFQQGIEAVRILLLEGLNKSATFVNSTKSMEQLG